MKLNPFILAAVICALDQVCFAQTTTWINKGNTSISSSQVAQIISMKLSAPPANAYVNIAKGTNVVRFDSGDFVYSGNASSEPGANWPWPITIAGPADISFTGGGLVTVKVLPDTSEVLPSTAVVIPTDATGPVNIILESSSDLISWTPALPGTYGTSTTNRFFRVRAVLQ